MLTIRPARRLPQRASRVLAALVLCAVATGCGDDGGLPADAPPQARAALEACGNILDWSEKEPCYEAALMAEVGARGVRSALDLLAVLATADRTLALQTHAVTHGIGIAAYDPEAGFAASFEECTDAFLSGCYHGTVQAHFIAVGETDAAYLNAMCEPYEQDPGDRWILFQCLHGMGHGLAMFHGYHLPRALDACDLLSTQWNRESCYGGAFMENAVNAIHPHHPASEHAAAADGHADGGHAEHAAGDHADDAEAWEALRPDEPHYPCSFFGDRFLAACYLIQTSPILHHNGGDFAAAGQACLGAPGREAPEALAEEMRQICFVSLGRDAAGHTLQDHQGGLAECGKAPAEYREWCYAGFVKHLNLSSDMGDGFAFCARVDPDATSRCHQALGETLLELHPDETVRAEECARSQDEEGRRGCLRGARVPLPATSL